MTVTSPRRAQPRDRAERVVRVERDLDDPDAGVDQLVHDARRTPGHAAGSQRAARSPDTRRQAVIHRASANICDVQTSRSSPARAGGIGSATAPRSRAPGFASTASDVRRPELPRTLDRLDALVCAHGISGRRLGDGPVETCTEEALGRGARREPEERLPLLQARDPGSCARTAAERSSTRLVRTRPRRRRRRLRDARVRGVEGRRDRPDARHGGDVRARRDPLQRRLRRA